MLNYPVKGLWKNYSLILLGKQTCSMCLGKTKRDRMVFKKWSKRKRKYIVAYLPFQTCTKCGFKSEFPWSFAKYVWKVFI